MTDRILRLISGIIDNDTRYRKDSKVLPVLRMLVSILAIILCACSSNAIFVIAILAVELVRLSFLPTHSMTRVLKRLPLPVIFTMIIMLPAVFLGHPRTMLTVTMKVLVSVLILAIMNEDLSWKEITGSFSQLHLPDVFTMTLDMTVRFLTILSRLCQTIHEAYILRAVSVHRQDKSRMLAAGGILGTIFLKSSRMSEETTEAMECRCFNGTYSNFTRHKLSVYDILYACIIPLMIVFFIIT
ncbi:MAG: hypothetical protein II133_04195 [Lachnospiraceae bacterium]|nr:hypothetical protein [Lachnospiraceae bacterium]